jgi:predicted porin
MKGRIAATASAAATVMFCLTNGASAADLDAKAPVLKAPAGAEPAACSTVVDFFTTACQVAAYGVRVYGTVDAGYGYMTNGSNFDKYLTVGVSYSPGKFSNGGRWTIAPNALTQSHVGVLVNEPLAGGWSFVGQLETPFDPYSGLVPSGSKTQHENLFVPLAQQTSSNDTNHNGRFWSSEGYFGFSSDTWGTLTFLRQGNLLRDINQTYDPMFGSAAYSLIGTAGTYGGGGGNGEQVRQTTSVKYRVIHGDYRLGVFGQFGGYDLGNSAKGVIQGSVGADFFNLGSGILSIDAAGSYARDAVAESLGGGNTVNPLTGLGNPNGIPTTITATISNNTAALAEARYTIGKLKISGGYEWIRFAAPSNVPASFTDISGFAIGAGAPNTAINTTNYSARNRVVQLGWAGFRYSITDSLDIAAAYYHSWQNDYSNGAATAGSNGKTTCAVINTALSSCAGSNDWAALLLDWRFAPKWDTYIGTSFTQLNGGQDSGFLAHNNWNTTAGIRFRW